MKAVRDAKIVKSEDYPLQKKSPLAGKLYPFFACLVVLFIIGLSAKLEIITPRVLDAVFGISEYTKNELMKDKSFEDNLKVNVIKSFSNEIDSAFTKTFFFNRSYDTNKQYDYKMQFVAKKHQKVEFSCLPTTRGDAHGNYEIVIDRKTLAPPRELEQSSDFDIQTPVYFDEDTIYGAKAIGLHTLSIRPNFKFKENSDIVYLECVIVVYHEEVTKK